MKGFFVFPTLDPYGMNGELSECRGHLLDGRPYITRPGKRLQFAIGNDYRNS